MRGSRPDGGANGQHSVPQTEFAFKFRYPREPRRKKCWPQRGKVFECVMAGCRRARGRECKPHVLFGSQLHQALQAAIMICGMLFAGRRWSILKLDVTTEETMSPIARNPMTSSLLAAA